MCRQRQSWGWWAISEHVPTRYQLSVTSREVAVSVVDIAARCDICWSWWLPSGDTGKCYGFSPARASILPDSWDAEKGQFEWTAVTVRLDEGVVSRRCWILVYWLVIMRSRLPLPLPPPPLLPLPRPASFRKCRYTIPPIWPIYLSHILDVCRIKRFVQYLLDFSVKFLLDIGRVWRWLECIRNRLLPSRRLVFSFSGSGGMWIVGIIIRIVIIIIIIMNNSVNSVAF